jgi:SWI/SNF-related matrix-associated actin-dependent regulator of chromatin subfamily A3
MLSKERAGDSPGALPPFWVSITDRGRPAFLFSLSQAVFPTPPAPVRGGLLADDMGLGKSVQLLATVCSSWCV